MKVRILLDQRHIGGISKKWQERAKFVQKVREWQMLRILGAAELTISTPSGLLSTGTELKYTKRLLCGLSLSVGVEASTTA